MTVDDLITEFEASHRQIVACARAARVAGDTDTLLYHTGQATALCLVVAALRDVAEGGNDDTSDDG